MDTEKKEAIARFVVRSLQTVLLATILIVPRPVVLALVFLLMAAHMAHNLYAVQGAAEYYREPLFAVKDLHRPVDADDFRVIGKVCKECSSGGTYTFFPCSTAEAAEGKRLPVLR